MRVSEVVKASGVGREALRFYESKGLVVPAGRTQAGYREYAADTVERLHFIKRSQRMGFSLTEIAELLALVAGDRATCGNVSQSIAAKLEDVEQQIQLLQQRQAVLRELLAACRAQDAAQACSILPT